MTYAAKGDRVFRLQDPNHPDCTPEVRRSDHRLKRFHSTADKRAWDYWEERRASYMRDLMSGSQTCLVDTDSCHKYVPLEDLIRILMAERDKKIKDLEERLRRKKMEEGEHSQKKSVENISGPLKERISRENLSNALENITEERDNTRAMLREAMHKLQNIDVIVNENRSLQGKLRCSEERVKVLEEKKKTLERELADLRSRSQIQVDLERAQRMLSDVSKKQEDALGMEETVLHCLSLERDELQEKVKVLEKELEESRKKEEEIEILRKKSESDNLDKAEIAKENECYKKKLASMKCLEKQIQDLKREGRALADKYRRETQKASDELSRMSQAAKELQSLREERDALRKRVNELASYECEFHKLQRKLQKVDAVIAENENLNLKINELQNLEKENQQLKCRLLELQEVEMNMAEDKERITQLQCAVADQEEEMKDLLCQIERLTSGRIDEELERLRCELYEKSSKLKLCEEQLAEIPMLEAEIDELRTKLQTCCNEFPEQKKSENRHQKLIVQLPSGSRGIHVDYKTPEERYTTRNGPCTGDRMKKAISDCKELMSCEDVENLLQRSKAIISRVLDDMNKHQDEMEELEARNKDLKEEVEMLNDAISDPEQRSLLRKIQDLKRELDEKNKEISELKNSALKAARITVDRGTDNRERDTDDTDSKNEYKPDKDEDFSVDYVPEPKKMESEESKKLSELSEEECCKYLRKKTEDMKLQIKALNKLTEKLKEENKLLRELQKPCPDFSKELDEKCALENLLSLLQAELDAFKGQKLSDECEALRKELKRVLEQNCQLKALVSCYKQRLDLERQTSEILQQRMEEQQAEKVPTSKASPMELEKLKSPLEEDEIRARKPDFLSEERDLESIIAKTESKTSEIKDYAKPDMQKERFSSIPLFSKPFPEKDKESEGKLAEEESLRKKAEKEEMEREKEGKRVKREVESKEKVKSEEKLTREEKEKAEEEAKAQKKAKEEEAEEAEEEAEAKKKAEEEAEAKKKAEEEAEAKKKAEEEEAEEAEEEARAKEAKEAEEAEEEARAKKAKEAEEAGEEAEAKKKAEEEEAEEAEEEARAKKAKKAEEAEEEAKAQKKAEEEAKAQKKAEDEKEKAEEEAKAKKAKEAEEAEEEAKAQKKAEEEKEKAEEEAKAKKAKEAEEAEEEAKAQKKAEEEAKAQMKAEEEAKAQKKSEEEKEKAEEEAKAKKAKGAEEEEEEAKVQKKAEEEKEKAEEEAKAKRAKERVSEEIKGKQEKEEPERKPSPKELAQKLGARPDEKQEEAPERKPSPKELAQKLGARPDEKQEEAPERKPSPKELEKALQEAKGKAEGQREPVSKGRESSESKTDKVQEPAKEMTPDEELKSLREEVKRLREENDSLRKQLEAAKRREGSDAQKEPGKERGKEPSKKGLLVKKESEDEEGKPKTGSIAKRGKLSGKKGDKEVQDAIAKTEAENEEKIKKLVEQHEKELADREKAFSESLSGIKSGYEGDIRKLTERHKASVNRLQELHEDEVKELSAAHETQMGSMQKGSQAALMDVAKGTAAKMKKLEEDHVREVKALKAQLNRSQQELEDLKKERGKSTSDIDQMKARHLREMQKIRKTSKQKLDSMRDLMEDEKKKSLAEISQLKAELQAREGDTLNICKFDKKGRARDGRSLDFNEVLEKILREGIDALSFNEIVLVHRKACCALQGIVMRHKLDLPALELEPSVDEPCPHTPLLEADKQQLLSRIFALENEISRKQKQTQEAILGMEMAIKKERCRLLDVKNLLQNEQRKNSQLKLLISSQTQFHSALQRERDELDSQASFRQTLCEEKTRLLEEEMKSKRCLEAEVEKLKYKLRQACMAMNMEKGNYTSQQRDKTEMMRIRMEEAVQNERKLGLQLEKEIKCRLQLQCQLQSLRQSLRHMVSLPDAKCTEINTFEDKSDKERKNLDQIIQNKNNTKPKPFKKHKK